MSIRSSSEISDIDAVAATNRDVLQAQQGIEISNRALYSLKRDEGLLQLRLRLLELRLCLG